MAVPDSLSFLGQGWGFPPSFDPATKSLALARDEEDIRQSLYVLLHTEPGERVMQPDYGCALRQFLFVSIDRSVLTQLQDVISRAILRYEPRVLAGPVLADTTRLNDGVLLLEVSYTIRVVNSRHNIVFPFYLREATLLPTVSGSK